MNFCHKSRRSNNWLALIDNRSRGTLHQYNNAHRAPASSARRHPHLPRPCWQPNLCIKPHRISRFTSLIKSIMLLLKWQLRVWKTLKKKLGCPRTGLKNLRISAPNPTSSLLISIISPSHTRRTRVRVSTRPPAVMKRTLMIIILVRNWAAIGPVIVLRSMKRQVKPMRTY